MERTLNNLRKALREAAARAGLPAFWQWWRGELARLAPSTPRTALQRRRQRPILAFGAGKAVLWEPRVEDGAVALVEAGTIVLEPDPISTANAGRDLLEGVSRRVARGAPVKLLVALPGSEILRRQLTLPAAVEENLRDALAFDLDRLTPFRPEDLYFDAVVVERDVARRQIRVDWAAALRSSIDAACRHAESWGGVVVGVIPEAPRAEGGTSTPLPRWSKLNLLPHEARAETVLWRRPGVVVPAVLLVLLVAAATIFPIWQKRDYVINLIRLAEQARVDAMAADISRRQLEQAAGEFNFMLTKKYAYPSTVKLLDDVTKLLPDDTWLTQLEIKTSPKGKDVQREMILRGESANAGKLISALEDSKLVEQAAPRSPTTKIQPGPGEVFDIGGQLKSLSVPSLVQLAGAPATGPAAPAAGTDAAGKARPAGGDSPASPRPSPGAPPSAPPAAPSAAPPAGPPAGPPGAAPAPGGHAAPAAGAAGDAAPAPPPPAPPAHAGPGGAGGSPPPPAGPVPAPAAAPSAGAGTAAVPPAPGRGPEARR